MKTCTCKMQHFLFVLLMFALAACSGGGSGSVYSTTSSETGAVSAKLDYGTKSAGKTLGKSAADVTSVRLIVTGPTIPTAKGTFPGNTGGTVSVYPGNDLIVTALGFDVTGVLIYEGFATGVSVTSGATTTVNNIQMGDPVIKAENASCLTCHENTKDITGQNLFASYKQSGHYTNETLMSPLNGGTMPGCAGCHGTQHQDIAPSTSGRCYTCHGAALSLRHTKAGTVLTNARYLSLGNNNCSACHEPHNPINGTGKQERKDWAESKHGNVNALAWMDYDFTTRAACNACHTPGGFTQAIGSGWFNTAVIPGTAMQPLTCDGCHSSNDFANSVRTLSAGTVNGGYKAGMGGFGTVATASIQFLDVGESNLCIPCHASRENGASLKAAISTSYVGPTSGGFKNPHYLAAAATFYGVGGFQFYTSGVRYNTYGAAGKVGQNANWSHGKLGMSNYSASGNNDLTGVSNATGTKGQCVACHLGKENTHTFDAAEVANASIVGATNTSGGFALTRSCYGCHKGYTNSTIPSISGFIEEEKEIWNRLFDFFGWQLQQYGINYTEALYPYFFQSDMTTAFNAWNTTVGTTFGGPGVSDSQQTMGSAMNLALLVREKGSFVHNRSFGRALIADSITYLQKGDVGDRSVASTDPNTIIKFSAYSAARPTSYPGQVGPNISITTLKSYLTRSSGGLYTRR